jgi:2-phosphinomethylmalic acid synthase
MWQCSQVVCVQQGGLPLYGRDAQRTRAGIHADGLNKFWWMYAPVNVPELPGRSLEVSLTKESGLAGLVFLVRLHTGLELAKDDAHLQQVYAWLMEEFDNGRQTCVEWEELALALARYMGEVVVTGD